MRLPRRVPWSSLAELDQVCSWIYTDEYDLDAKVLAVNRLSAWRAITPPPHSLDAALSLLSAVLLDRPPKEQTSSPSSSSSATGGGSSLNVRQSYATAIVRFVNGLVDPLQLGTYARSIASIAAQIGLPQWLVELRHAVTHEELPSLELLRSGARESLTWLLHNYFLPTLSSTSTNSEQHTESSINLSPLAPLLKQYKELLKITTRDASLKTQYKTEITKVLRDIERWVGEAKVAASSVWSNGFGAAEMGGEDDDRERWALERLSEGLLERGGLVPVSSKKRLASKLNASPVLPPSLVAIWSPLLHAMQSRHSLFTSTIVSTIASQLLIEKDESQKIDLSFDLCLAGWGYWCITNLGSSSTDASADASVNREEVVSNLVIALGPEAMEDKSKVRKGATALLDLLLQDDEHLQQTAATLLTVSRSAQDLNDSWQDMDAQIMEKRLRSLLDSVQPSSEPVRNTDVPIQIIDNLVQQDDETKDPLPEGWSLVPEASWRACPIGVYVR